MPRTEYDKDTQILWVHWTETKGQTLLHRAELQPYIDAMIDGVSARGEKVKEVRAVFYEHDAAAYNRDNLAFARIGTWMAGDPPTKFAAHGTPEFDVREDGGIS